MARPGRYRSRGFLRRLAVLAILAYGLRALIPGGYMVGQVDGHASLVVCADGIDFARSPLAGMDHVGGMHHAGMHHAAHASAHCPFALAGGAGLLAQTQAPAEAYFVQWRPPAAAVLYLIPAAPPWRHHAPRGPPTLA